MPNKKILKLVYEQIVSSADSTDSNGLLDGRMGMSMFLYDYSRKMNSDAAQHVADNLVEKAWEYVHLTNLTYSFYHGRAGVAWALSELGRKGFLEIDDELNSYIIPTDAYVLKHQRAMIPVIIDIESELFITGIYMVSRCAIPGLDFCINYHWREYIIYYVDYAEGILYRKTGSNNVFLPQMTLHLLNSILYYLAKIHPNKIYPHKTYPLIKFIHKQISGLLSQSKIQDLITTRCLLDMINDDIPFEDMDRLDEQIAKSHVESEHLLDALAEAGLYSILYDNSSIFEETWLATVRQYPNLYDIIFVKNDRLPIKTYLGIGHGLLAIYGKRGML